MCTKMFFSLVLLVFQLAETLTISQGTDRKSTLSRRTRQDVQECQTEEQTRGKCIGLVDCLPYITRLRKNADDTAYIQFLQRSNRICQMPRPVVCCPCAENLSNNGSDKFLENLALTNHLNCTMDRNYSLPTFENDCGITKVNIRRIVGGEPAEKNAWPWMALIAYLDNSGRKTFRCGGSLITNRHVLTAAHCLTGDERVVRLGEHDLTTDLETKHEDVDIARATRHPSYDTFDKHSDIGIIYLKHDVQFTDQIRAICLPVTSQLRTKSYIGYNPIAIGFGHTQRGGNSSAILLQLQIPILDNNVCLLRYREQNALKSSKQFDSAVLCAGSLNGKDTCQGDSGGPLMVAEKIDRKHHFVLAGIVSNGRGCGAGIPGVYTRVQSFIDWIEQKVHESP